MKKNNTPKKTARKQTIKQRAQVIIGSDRYSADTRKAIQLNLEHGYTFLADMVGRAERGEEVDDFAPARVVPIVGTVGDEGIKLFDEEEEKRIEREAQTVHNFLFGGPPDFLMECVLSTLSRAFAHCHLHEPGEVGYPDDYDAENLKPLFLKTKLISWDEMWPDDDNGTKVLRAMSEILHNPETPAGLYEAVADFACTQSNECGDDFYHSDDFLTAILNTVYPSERRGAIIAERNARESEGGPQ